MMRVALTPTPTPPSVRVLVVDDSAVARRVISNALTALPGIEAVGTASNIQSAKNRIQRGGVDAALIDVALRRESGVDLLKWLRAQHKEIACVLITAGNADGVRTEVDALMLGAAGFVAKPSGPAAQQALIQSLEETLSGLRPKASTVAAPPRRARVVQPAFREVIALGASTGGPPVLATILQRLPRDFDVPILIAQHIPKMHAPYLADLLAERSGRKVVLGKAGMCVDKSHVYIAGDGLHMTVARQGSRLVLVQDMNHPEHHCRPAVDPLFRSVAEACGAACVGAVISGMGRDGAQGAVALADKGAPVVAQDQKSSVIWSMPGAAVAAGATVTVAPPQGIADCISKWTEWKKTGCNDQRRGA